MSDKKEPFDIQTLLRNALAFAHALRSFHGRGHVHGHLTAGDFSSGNGPLEELSAIGSTDVFSEARLKYASPEQAGRLQTIDKRSDIYSLGIVYYEMFTGKTPFDSVDVLTLIHNHMAVRPTPPHLTEPRIPKIVSDIIMKQLAKSPEARYASCEGLIDNLHTCLSTLTSVGEIPPFEIGGIDRDSQFLIPNRLYGREREISILDTTFNRAMRGEIVLCLVAGYSGVGKSSLVRRMRDHIAACGGMLVEGKFDQYRRETPYSALLEAFGGLVRQLLGGSSDSVAPWRARVEAVLGENASVVIDVLPEIEILIGPKPPAPELSDAAARDRFNHVFTELLKVFASEGSPLVMFLDDLQWIDIASVALLRNFVSHARNAHLLVIGAYRDNEVDAAHLLTGLLEELRAHDAPIYELLLGPLSSDDLATMIKDTCVRLNKPEALAKLVMQKTGGNPFFSRQFLKAMYFEKLLYFDLGENAWRWVSSTQLEDRTSNVVELMMGRLAMESLEARVALKVAACIGKQFDLELLATVMQMAQSCVLTLLARSLQDELLVPIVSDGSEVFAFSFAHDRVQQASYQQQVGPLHPEVHLAIGRALWPRGLWSDDPQALQQQAVFAIADQINRALELLPDGTERRDVAFLNLIAAQRARGSLAYAAAARYLEAGMRCLPAVHRWSDHYSLTYKLYLASAEIYSLLNDEEPFQKILSELLEHVELKEDRLDVRICQTAHYCLSSRMYKGLEVGCLGLSEIDVSIPPLTDKAALKRAFEKELAKFREETNGQDLEKFLFDLPRVNDRLSDSMLRLIGAMGDAATIMLMPLLSLLSVIGARRSIKYGNTTLSPLMYTLLGQGVIANERAYLEGRMLAQTAVRLMKEKSLDLWSYGRERAHALWHISHWSENRRNLLEPIEEAFLVTRRAHDPLYAGYLLNVSAIIRYFAGRSMDEVLAAHERVIEHCRPYEKMSVITAFTQCYAGAASALRSETDSLTSITGKYVDEAEFLRLYADTPMVMGLLAGAKAPLYGYAGKWRDVIELADSPNLAISPPFIPHLPIMFWNGLAALKLLADAGNGAEATALQARFERALQYLCTVRDTASPDNVAHHIYFLLAERARLEKRPHEVETQYRHAIAAAEQHAYCLDQAYFEEIFGLWLSADRKQGGAAREMLQSAQRRYMQTQAHVLAGRVSQALSMMNTGSLSADVSSLDRVDTLAILQAVQALNRQLELKPLLDRLLTIILDVSGAERGCIARVDGDCLHLEWSVGEATDNGLPKTLVRYVAKSRAAVILDSPALITADRPASTFSQDPFFQSTRPMSVLCQPIDRQAPVRRVLYLEHRSMANTFGVKKQQVLSLLCLQAAILIENAEHYSRLESMVSERTRELEDANAELRRQQIEIERARDAAQSAARAKAQFLANMSHEIRTPLNTMMGMTHLALALDLPSAARHYLDKAQFSAEHLLSIINDVLEFSRIDGGHLNLVREKFSLEAAFRDLTTLVSYKAFEKGLHLIYDIDPGVPDSLIGDALRVKQILVNLIGNAVKFTESGHIGVTVRLASRVEETATVQFEVVDTGIGIEPQEQSHLFQKFTQIDSSKNRKYGGTGLGLAICKGLVEAMGGSIGISSAPQAGSTFHFAISFEVAIETPVATSSSVAERRVLLAESNELSRAHNIGLLQSLGLHVEGAKDYPDASAAIQKAAEENASFDIVIFDVEFLGRQSLKEKVSKGRASTLILNLRSPGTAGDSGQAGEQDAQVTLPLLRGVLREALQQRLTCHAAPKELDKLIAVRKNIQLRHNRMLIVDDSELNREVLVELLRFVGVETVEASDGLQALCILEKSADFDCVILDYHMPHMDGMTAAIKMRERGHWNSIAIVMLTGDVHSVRNGSVDAILIKPVNIEKLLDAIDDATQKRQ
ncbi:MAG: Response regulator [Nitrospira sp.]|nr:MAG: Response regulator [Nitrospira sp.]